MLYQCFASKTEWKYGYLVDFFTTMRAHTYAHRCSLFKTARKTGF